MAGATVGEVGAGATVVAVATVEGVVAGATVVAVATVAAVCISTDSCQFPGQLLPVPCQA